MAIQLYTYKGEAAETVQKITVAENPEIYKNNT